MHCPDRKMAVVATMAMVGTTVAQVRVVATLAVDPLAAAAAEVAAARVAATGQA
jgi:hypothetical protein